MKKGLGCGDGGGVYDWAGSFFLDVRQTGGVAIRGVVPWRISNMPQTALPLVLRHL